MTFGGGGATNAALSVVVMAALAIAVVPTPVAGTTGTLIITTDTTLTEDHNGDIVIAADDITLDCAGYSVTGSGSGFGIVLDGRTGVTVKNCHVRDFTYGLHLIISNNNILTGNNASSGIRGISLGLSDNNTLIGNNASGSSQGISITSSNNNTLIGNNASGSFQGIYLSFSSNNNFLTGNNASDNVQGIYLEFSNNNTLTGNNANSSGIGIILSSSDNNTVTGNNASSNGQSGITVDSSNNNTLTGNNASSSGLGGFYILDSNNNTFTGNNASVSGLWGFGIFDSNNNTFTGNNASGISQGISITSSNNNTLTGNNASSSSIGISLGSSNNNTLARNNASDNGQGIWLSFSDSNVLTENTVSSNTDYGIYLNASSNTIHHNDFIENTIQAFVVSPHDNTWSNASGGNYWSDYTGVDADGDGIGDTPYAIFRGNQDDSPLMCLWKSPPPRPAACFSTFPESPVIGDTITFDASASYDPDGFVASYDWDFGDGNTTTVTDPVIIHVYPAPGSYTVELTVTDNDGLGSSISRSIAVAANVSTAPQNLEATAGDAQVDLAWQSPFSDGGSAITNIRIYRGTSSGSLSFLVEVGDLLTYTDTGLTNGVTQYYEVSAVNAVGEGPRSNDASATPMIPDTTSPTVTITSPSDGMALPSIFVLISGTASDNVAVEEVELSLDGTTYFVVSGTTSWSSGTVTLAEGLNTIYARATDTAGNTETVSIAVTVDTIGPAAVAGEDQMVNAGDTVSFDASGSSDDVAIVSYAWDFGDGTTGTGETVTHIYTVPGTYTVTLGVQDAAGNADTDMLVVTVEAEPVNPIPLDVVTLGIVGVVAAAAAGVALLLWRRRAAGKGKS